MERSSRVTAAGLRSSSRRSAVAFDGRLLGLHEKDPGLGRGLGVSDGARTRDNRDHNPVLYQLSYTHHVRMRHRP